MSLIEALRSARQPDESRGCMPSSPSISERRLSFESCEQLPFIRHRCAQRILTRNASHCLANMLAMRK